MSIVINKSYFKVNKHTKKEYHVVTDVKELSVGDTIIITGRPSSWSSLYSDGFPLNQNIFPYGMKILQMGEKKGLVSATCGTYGWSLSYAVKEGKVLKYNE